jgi:hypothetical protein
MAIYPKPNRALYYTLVRETKAYSHTFFLRSLCFHLHILLFSLLSTSNMVMIIISTIT